MKKVLFWQIGDTVVSVSKADNKRWVKDQHQLNIEGREDSLQELGFVGFRQSFEALVHQEDLNCNQLFKGSLRGVSRPTFQEIEKPENVIFIEKP